MRIEVRTKQVIGAPIATVFDAWVEPAKMAGYFISSGSGPMTAGQTVVWRFDDHGGAELAIHVKAVEAPARIAFEWSPGGAMSEVEVLFRALSERTTEVSVRDGAFESDAAGIARYGEQMQGWVHMLTCLKAYLEHEGVNLRETPGEPCGLTVERALKASAADIFRAWTSDWDQWFGGVPGSGVIRVEQGAPFYFEAIGPNEKRYPHYCRFLQLDRDRLVEHAWVTEATRGVETRVRIELNPRAGGTLVRLSHTGFRDRASMRAHETAWPSVLEHLDRWLAR